MTDQNNTVAEECPDFEVFVSVFSAAFGEGASMPIETACFRAARDIGIYANVRRNCQEFMKHPSYVEATRRCGLRAGLIAAEEARKIGLDFVDVECFLYAVRSVEGRINKVRERLKGSGFDEKVMGGMCS